MTQTSEQMEQFKKDFKTFADSALKLSASWDTLTPEESVRLYKNVEFISTFQQTFDLSFDEVAHNIFAMNDSLNQ